MSTGGLALANNVIKPIANLAHLVNDDVLYITAHHNKFLPFISDGTNRLDVYELCDAIKNAGLPAAHRL